MKPRVLLITSIYPPQVGGPAIFTSRYSEWLSHQNIENIVISYNITKEKSTKSKILVCLHPIRALSFLTFVYKIIRNSGHKISAVINRDKITGCQFHPEKSGPVGLKILGRFILQ